MSGSYIHNTVLNLVVHMHLILGLCFIVCLLIFPLAGFLGDFKRFATGYTNRSGPQTPHSRTISCLPPCRPKKGLQTLKPAKTFIRVHVFELFYYRWLRCFCSCFIFYLFFACLISSVLNHLRSVTCEKRKDSRRRNFQQFIGRLPNY